MINAEPLISFNDSQAVIKWRILICEVHAHLVVISFIVLLELECFFFFFFTAIGPGESIQSARSKLEGQELITKKAATRDFAKSFLKAEGRCCDCTVFPKSAASNDDGESV